MTKIASTYTKKFMIVPPCQASIPLYSLFLCLSLQLAPRQTTGQQMLSEARQQIPLHTFQQRTPSALLPRNHPWRTETVHQTVLLPSRLPDHRNATARPAKGTWIPGEIPSHCIQISTPIRRPCKVSETEQHPYKLASDCLFDDLLDESAEQQTLTGYF
eukprot:SAG31_NODE_3068_length_4720_cov_9.192258_2_plen_159_part_00